jgi:2-polyprenyl-3-methyl-5-hydroxy-6-metoxy-1,4-benzoquinol methylase
MFDYHLRRGNSVDSDLISEMSKLYSEHYGTWGPSGRNPGGPIRLSANEIRKRVTPDSLVVWATAFGSMVGYAIAIHAQLPEYGKVAWVTQLVVHREHRQVDVGKTLLFTIWKFSDHFAWGLLSANPYAIRALEKATRRRCEPGIISVHAGAILYLGSEHVHYLDTSRGFVINETESRVNSAFDLDHSGLPEMLANATGPTKPWVLGDLPEGWEWFAFTFHEQQQIPLDKGELEEMMLASDDIAKQAYSRMQPEWGSHPWAQFAPEEVEFMLRHSGVPRGTSVLDFGCGDGRHAAEFAKSGLIVTGVDYVHDSAAGACASLPLDVSNKIRFITGDCRSRKLDDQFELGICLYDVIGSYADEHSNFEILKNLAGHIKEGGYVFLSVMNMELTERRAKHVFSLSSDPDKLLLLPPSDIMERSGNVFNPDYYLLDKERRIVYRKEQFRQGEDLFQELIVRDRRYSIDEITHMCIAAGLTVEWTRFVRAGHWDESLERGSEKAKEILVKCRRSYPGALQATLF